MDKKYLLNVFVYLTTGILAIALILFVIYHLAGFDSKDYATAAAAPIEAEFGFEAEGCIFREETVLKSDAQGRAYSVLKEGENVGKGDEVCGVYAENEEIFDALAKTDRMLEILKSSKEQGNLTAVNAETRALAAKLRESVYNGNAAGRRETDDRLLAVLERRSSETGAGFDADAEISALEEERKMLIRRLGQRRATVTAPFSGNYFKKLDGYEEIFSFEIASTLDPASFDELMQNAGPGAENAAGAGKIVSSSSWRLVMKTDSENAVQLIAGKKYTIRFSSGERAEMTLERMAADHRSKETLLVFLSRTLPNAELARCEKVKVIARSEKGLMVPTAALRCVESEEGEQENCVYVLKGNKIRRKKVEILTEQQGYYVVKDYTGDAEHGGYLQTNDVVITAGSGLAEGYAQ